MDRSDLIISSSQSLDKEVSKHTNSCRSVIPFGVDKCCSRITETHPCKITIGCFKALKPVYGLDKLISAYAIARPRIHLVSKLMIVGEGEMRPQLQQLINENNLFEYVELVGAVSHHRALELHLQCDLEIYPSKSEALGVSILEAMACGIPVIASNVGGIPEIISHNVNGVLVDVEIDANELAREIIRLCNNTKRINHLGGMAKLTIRDKYLFEKCVEKLVDKYKLVSEG